ncbi:hypothetical protein LNTAR_25270 [Lentisphaera araneosa HTCC2155]|uniref:Nucleotidyl transferase AbiEii/AbiGii toxin family protein n=1 Tax=Lentisphaera araneosa HTCC2155 TaxID=313628 RepID=A6DS96_9BACT|nr:nucleotidyl transferase AbiEii/AbiGii toxin family protein [Lentisphaera araneosa]EDM25441.1 hypothetical protein LNTAR_25270 [Lentisphaera araneosa HTCC2155]
MNLHENGELFQQAVRATAQRMGMLEIFIEKDYWVVYALLEIFSNETLAEYTVFKGGTSLSKCFDLIDRFSEDIDLVVKHQEGESDNQLKKKIRAISQLINQTMPEHEVEGLTIKRGMNRKTAHEYAQQFQGDFGQAREFIVLEATWLGYYEPYMTKNISSYIYEMMMHTEQEAMVKEYGLEPFELQVLNPTRTLCEKIMSLLRFSHSENAMNDLKNKIRHIYDLCKLLEDPDLRFFFNSEGFIELLIKVARDDYRSFRNNNTWLSHHPIESLIFNDVESVWQELKVVYHGQFKDLVYGELASDQAILQVLKDIRTRLSAVTWNIVNK